MSNPCGSANKIVGSRFEHLPHKLVEFELWHRHCRFTDDTVMTIATAEALLTDRDFGDRWGRRYPRAGYGGEIREWLASDTPLPYVSWGDGAAMRVSANLSTTMMISKYSVGYVARPSGS